jgi:hypothetical protein
MSQIPNISLEKHVADLAKNYSDLEHYTTSFALEGIDFGAFRGMFQSLLGSVESTMKYVSEFLGFEKVGAMSIEPKKFASTIKSIPYTSVSEMSAVVPEGMKGTFMEALDAVERCVDHIPVGMKMLDEYELFLAQFVADRKFNIATYDDRKIHTNAEKIRKDLFTMVGKVFTDNSYQTKRKIKDVVKRNGEWEVIIKRTNDLIARLESIDRDAVQRKIKQCVAYLDIIAKNFAAEKDRKVSQEAAQRLGNMAQSVGREMEFFSVVYYRALSLRGAIQNTSEAVQSVMG